jgi:adenine specific DNA methylase Mod
MRNWLFCETRNFAKQPVSSAKQRNSFRIEFRETKSKKSFAGNPRPLQRKNNYHQNSIREDNHLPVIDYYRYHVFRTFLEEKNAEVAEKGALTSESGDAGTT